MDLKDFFVQYNKIALAFSGGVDSSYLLYAASVYGADVKAYYVKTAFQPEFEFQDAIKLASQVGIIPEIINLDILGFDEITSNPCNRCYYCKTHIFTSIMKKASDDGYNIIIDGTNASDDVNDRPGMKALTELKVLSPLRMCGLTKTRIRELSRDAGLITADKPSYSCLATRIHTDETITAEKLRNVESSENILFALGFSDFRVRVSGNNALLQFTSDELQRANQMLRELKDKLSGYFSAVEIDAQPRRKGL